MPSFIQKGIEYSPIYLVRFFRNLLLGDGWVLKNRYLHIHPTKEWKMQPNLKEALLCNNTREKVDRKSGQKDKSLGINRSAVSKHLKALKEKEIIKRIGPDKGGKWNII